MEKRAYQRLSTVLKNQSPGWLWTEIDPNFTTVIKDFTENFFYDRYINSLNPERFKRYFTTYCNMYKDPFMKMYDVYVTEIDPLTSRSYHEDYKSNTLRDNAHNTTNENTMTNNLTDNSTRTDNLKQTSSGTNTRTDDLTTNNNIDVTRTDNLHQTVTHTGTNTTNDNGHNQRTDDLTQDITHQGKDLHSDTPQSNVSSATVGFPEVTWTYATDLRDNHSTDVTHNTGTQANISKNDSTLTFDDDITTVNGGTQTTGTVAEQTNTGTQTTDITNTQDNTGTQTNNSTHTGTQTNSGTSNLKIDDNENTQGERNIKEQSATSQELYEKYWSYLKNSNVWVWLMAKLDVCFLNILGDEWEEEYGADYYPFS